MIQSKDFECWLNRHGSGLNTLMVNYNINFCYKSHFLLQATLSKWMCSAPSHLRAEGGSMVNDRGSQLVDTDSSLSLDGAAGMCH